MGFLQSHLSLQREKFKFHNAQWLEIVQSQKAFPDNDGVYHGDAYDGEAYAANNGGEGLVAAGEGRPGHYSLDDDDPLCYADIDAEFEALIRQSDAVAAANHHE